MKKYLAVLLVMVLVVCVFVGCGEQDVETDNFVYAAELQGSLPQIPTELITDESYQFITISPAEHVYKVTETTYVRSHLLYPEQDSLTVSVDLTNSNTRADKYSLALWESDGDDMLYITTAYARANDTVQSHTFTGLDSTKTYRIITSVDRGYTTGKIYITNGTINNENLIEEVEEE